MADDQLRRCTPPGTRYRHVYEWAEQHRRASFHYDYLHHVDGHAVIQRAANPVTQHLSRFARVVFLLTIVLGIARPLAAQATITDVLSFLLTNRSVNTGDFARDTQAA